MMNFQKLLIPTLVLVVCLSRSTAFSFSSSSNENNNALSSTKSYVEIFDPRTNVNVVLLGCLHGSLSSSEDVRYLMDSQTTDAVVLELCDARVGDFRREPVDEYTMNTFLEDMKEFWEMAQMTSRKKGPFAATATLLLGTMSLLQTNLSGFRAGLEFAVALDIAKEKPSCDVFLADQKIEDTMERIANLPAISLEMIKNNTIGVEAKLLKTALFGDQMLPKSTQVNMPQVMVRSKRAITDLARLTLPPIVISTFFLLSIFLAVNYLPFFQELQDLVLAEQLLIDDNSYNELMTNAASSGVDQQLEIALRILSSILTESLALAIGFLFVTLPAAKAIITERDVVLADGIRGACENVSSSGEKEARRIVVVLGLLHVNGVSKQLLDSGAVSAK